MKKIFFIAAVAAAALSACSNDQTVATSGDTGAAMEFRTVTDKSTRAAIADDDNILGFTVTAWWDKDDSNTYGSADASVGAFLFNAKDITRGEKGATAWDYTPKRYWPTAGTVDFFAYSPASSGNLTSGLKDLAAATPGIVYTVPEVSDTNPQEDFLVAVMLDQTGKPDPKITLNFQHALSRVLFKAKKSVADIEYLIDGIELVNLYTTAELDLTELDSSDESIFPATGGFTYGGADPVMFWTDHDDLATQAVDFSASPVYVKTTETSVLGKTNALMVMPQETILGEVHKASDLPAPAFDDIDTPKNTNVGYDGEFYIKVSYKAYQDDFYYAGSATDSKEMFIPVKQPLTTDPLTFEMGRQYTFVLTFGAGEVGDPISFDVTVEDWDEVEANI